MDVCAISFNEEQNLSVILTIRTILMPALSPHAYETSVLLLNVPSFADGRHWRHTTQGGFRTDSVL